MPFTRFGRVTGDACPQRRPSDRRKSMFTAVHESSRATFQRCRDLRIESASCVETGTTTPLLPSPVFRTPRAMNQALLSPGAADALLFDLGRVVLDIDFNKTLSCCAGHACCQPAHLF